jgi:GPH family glycoside/pentoside/hexuronide:cation symporter
MSKVAPGASGAFGLWSFVSKLSLAFAAILLLPLLETAGFRAGPDNTEDALWALSLAYGLLPCLLKLLAIGLLATTNWKED